MNQPKICIGEGSKILREHPITEGRDRAFVHGLGRLDFVFFGSCGRPFVACSNSLSTGRGSPAVNALNLSYSDSALDCAISWEMRPACVSMSRSLSLRN